MPLLRIETNIEIDKEERCGLMRRASAQVAELLGKPESYVMISLQPACAMLFAGNSAPLAYLELKCIGLPTERNGQLASALCDFIARELEIEAARIYIEFADAPRSHWGWNGGTFER